MRSCFHIKVATSHSHGLSAFQNGQRGSIFLAFRAFSVPEIFYAIIAFRKGFPNGNICCVPREEQKPVRVRVFSPFIGTSTSLIHEEPYLNPKLSHNIVCCKVLMCMLQRTDSRFFNQAFHAPLKKKKNLLRRFKKIHRGPAVSSKLPQRDK